MSDNIHSPQHYISDNGLEALDVIEAFFHDNAFLANVFKYIARAGKKTPYPLEDLQKAEVYLQREIERVRDIPQRALFGAQDLDVPAEDKFFIEQMTQPATPRVWDSLQDVGEGPVVSTPDGWYYQWVLGTRELLFQPPYIRLGWIRSHSPEITRDHLGPFTEVLDASA